MRKKDLQNRRKMLFQALELIYRYHDEFLEKQGPKWIENKVNEILDEANRIKKELDEPDEKS